MARISTINQSNTIDPADISTVHQKPCGFIVHSPFSSQGVTRRFKKLHDTHPHYEAERRGSVSAMMQGKRPTHAEVHRFGTSTGSLR
jgi:hypothetical protein